MEILTDEARKYHLPAFSHWKNHHAFEAAFVLLEKDWRISLGKFRQRPKESERRWNHRREIPNKPFLDRLGPTSLNLARPGKLWVESGGWSFHQCGRWLKSAVPMNASRLCQPFCLFLVGLQMPA